MLVAEGVSAADFWEMSLREIDMVLHTIDKRREREAADNAALAWKLSELIYRGACIAVCGTKGGQFPSFQQAFPHAAKLMNQGNGTEARQATQDWTRLRDQMQCVAAVHNKAFARAR